MTSKDLHNAILDANFNIGRLYIGRCSQASVKILENFSKILVYQVVHIPKHGKSSR